MQFERYKKVLKVAVQCRPFRAFFVKLENGETYRITHPENIAWGKDGYTMIYTGDTLRAFVDAGSVTAVELPRNGRRHNGSRS